MNYDMLIVNITRVTPAVETLTNNYHDHKLDVSLREPVLIYGIFEPLQCGIT